VLVQNGFSAKNCNIDKSSRPYRLARLLKKTILSNFSNDSRGTQKDIYNTVMKAFSIKDTEGQKNFLDAQSEKHRLFCSKALALLEAENSRIQSEDLGGQVVKVKTLDSKESFSMKDLDLYQDVLKFQKNKSDARDFFKADYDQTQSSEVLSPKSYSKKMKDFLIAHKKKIGFGAVAVSLAGSYFYAKKSGLLDQGSQTIQNLFESMKSYPYEAKVGNVLDQGAQAGSDFLGYLRNTVKSSVDFLMPNGAQGGSQEAFNNGSCSYGTRADAFLENMHGDTKNSTALVNKVFGKQCPIFPQCTKPFELSNTKKWDFKVGDFLGYLRNIVKSSVDFLVPNGAQGGSQEAFNNGSYSYGTRVDAFLENMGDIQSSTALVKGGAPAQCYRKGFFLSRFEGRTLSEV
jgi:hypothetical protein